MSIIDVPSGADILGNLGAVSGSPHASASAAYDTWAAALGVSNTATLSALDADDGLFLIDVGFTPLLGGTNTFVGVSSEAGLYLYRSGTTAATQAAAASFTASGVSVSRAIGSTPAASCMLLARVQTTDLRSESGKWQKSGAEAIVFIKTRQYSSTSDAVDVAFRIRPQSVEVVATNVTAVSPNIYVFCPGSAATGAIAAAGFSGTVHYATGPRTSVSGTVRDGTGAPCERTVRIHDRSTGVLIYSTASSAINGTYLYDAGFSTTEVQRTVLDDAGGTLNNDLIDRVIPA